MTDDFGRVNPVSQHLLDRGGRGERYQGRNARKHHSEQDDTEPEIEFEETEGSEVPTAGTLVDVRI
jgi:hypothetical protein